MEQESVICAKFILGLIKDGHYVDPKTEAAAKTILNDYAMENDCYYDEDTDERDISDDDEYNWD